MTPNLSEFEVPTYTHHFLKKITSCPEDSPFRMQHNNTRENNDNYRDSFSYLNDPVLQLPYWNSKENYDNDDDDTE